MALFLRVYLTLSYERLKICSLFHSVLPSVLWRSPPPPCPFSFAVDTFPFSDLISLFQFALYPFPPSWALAKKLCWRLVRRHKAVSQEGRHWAVRPPRAILGFTLFSAFPTTIQYLCLIEPQSISYPSFPPFYFPAITFSKALRVTDTPLQWSSTCLYFDFFILGFYHL